MKVYYQFNWNPYCLVCLDTMMVDRFPEDRSAEGVIKIVAYCINKHCAQLNKRFVIPPLSAEIIEESETS